MPAAVAGRAVVCERLDMFPVECVARGYLTGSGLLEYRETGEVCGIALPAGLEDGSRLPEPIFTPGHQGRRSATTTRTSPSRRWWRRSATTPPPSCATLTLEVYARAEAIARERGIILADTKLEFGRRPDGTIVLADEVLTPDSSRFWPADEWPPGGPQPSYDKQVVRDWLTSRSPAGTAAPASRRRRCPTRSSSDPGQVRRGVRAADRRAVLMGGRREPRGALPVARVAFDYLVEPRNRPDWQSSLRTVEDVTGAPRRRPALGGRHRARAAARGWRRPCWSGPALDRGRPLARDRRDLTLDFHPEPEGCRVA